MTTTEELIARLMAVLDHGPVSSSSLQYAIATLNALAQRTRDLAGERDRLREALENHGEHDSRCVLSRWEAGEPTPEGYKTKYDGKWYGKDSLPKCQCGFDAALAPAEAGTPEPDEHVPCGECTRWHHDAADWGTAGVCMARLRKLGPPRGEDEYEERDADDGCSDRSERKPVTEEEQT